MSWTKPRFDWALYGDSDMQAVTATVTMMATTATVTMALTAMTAMVILMLRPIEP